MSLLYFYGTSADGDRCVNAVSALSSVIFRLSIDARYSYSPLDDYCQHIARVVPRIGQLEKMQVYAYERLDLMLLVLGLLDLKDDDIGSVMLSLYVARHIGVECEE